jgi:glycosyltransferase involved in cell wall biosynthesis
VPTEPRPSARSLTVVVPVRNVAEYLPDMLASLVRNADPDFEFVIVDDGSDDATPGVIDEFADRLPNPIVIRHEDAVGLADARNAGLAVATGRYVTFLDGDDWIAPDYLRRLVAAIEELGCDFVRVDHVQVRQRNRELHRAPEARRNVVLDPRSGILPATRRTMVDYPYAWAGAFRRDLGPLLEFPHRLHTAEDRPWIWRLHQGAGSYAVLPLAGVFYRRLVANSLTQIGDSRQLHFLDAFAQVLDGVRDEPELQPKAIRQFLAVLAHQLQTAARFTRHDRAVLRDRARTMLAGLPADVLDAALPRDRRMEVLHPLVPRPVRRVQPVAS